MRISAILLSTCTLLQLQATQVYIKNWSTLPVIITQVSEVNPDGTNITDTNIAIQPGQSTQLKHQLNSDKHTNFDQIKVTFTIDGYTTTEEIFFPAKDTEKATLSFTDSGYKRFPYNNIKK